MLSSGRSALWNSTNLFLLRLSFFKLGIVLRALIRASGFTRVEAESNLLELRLNSCREERKLMSVGRVWRPLAPKLRTVRLGSLANSIR